MLKNLCENILKLWQKLRGPGFEDKIHKNKSEKILEPLQKIEEKKREKQRKKGN